MVDFSRMLGSQSLVKPVIPIEIYSKLDRASDKGPLRPPQLTILEEWHTKRRQEKDVLIKLHTGQGKTLIGLLILQSKLNEGKGPAVYLCPNNYLIEQTCEQARQFGINVFKADSELPSGFMEEKGILVTSVQKLFNGRTKFKLGPSSIKVGTLLMDDAHACVDAIRGTFTITLKNNTESYKKILTLFADTLKDQGIGTFEEIKEGAYESLLPIPYWAWKEKEEEVAKIIYEQKDDRHVKFAWPLLKDMLGECQCVVSGTGIEISPYAPPLDIFGSYHNASHRVFMSATVTDDSFLVKGLRLKPDIIKNPLIDPNERWSGEKMILIPELIHESLDDSYIVSYLAKTDVKQYGIVALTPSEKAALRWEDAGAELVTKDNIDEIVGRLKRRVFNKTAVIYNRYDGIDLPDDACRILVIDGKPFTDSLIDRHHGQCRESSEIISMRIARSIEQGLGRSVRGEKDYSVIILSGSELVEAVRSKSSRKLLSIQAQAQIKIGLDIAEMAKNDLKSGATPSDVIRNLIGQSLGREEAWKQFYVNSMDSQTYSVSTSNVLDIFQQELEAELAYREGNWGKANEILQSLIDRHIDNDNDKGWYLQEMARYASPHETTTSNKLQIQAHKRNRFLLKPRTGMEVKQLVISGNRIASIVNWASQFDDYEGLQVAIFDILERLSFGVTSDRFESALHELGKALGFNCERPDKEWKQGPDNLWALRDGLYLIIECKNEVLQSRDEINKSETGQMNTAIAWFEHNYPSISHKNLMVIPTSRVSKAAGFNQPVGIMRHKELGKLRSSIKSFFKGFQRMDLKSLNPVDIQLLINSHKLTVEQICDGFSVPAVKS